MSAKVTTLDEQIARDWPEKWDKANDQNRVGASKRRNNIRRAYREAQAFDVWRAQHPTASCASCEHASPHTDAEYPFACDLEATGGWIAPVAAAHVCTWWRKR